MPEGSSRQPARNDGGEIATSTLAEIYAQQGLLGRALSIYRRLLARAPGDSAIAERIRSLETRMEEAGPEPAPEASRAPDSAQRERLPWDPPETEPAAEEAAPESAAEAPQPAVEAAPRHVGPMDGEAFRTWLSGR